MTVSLYRPGGVEQEFTQGKTIADEAVAAGAQFLIYSSVPSLRKVSNGKYPVDSFDIKGQVKDYIGTLPIKSAFFWPVSFMQNFHTYMAPCLGLDGSFAWYNFISPSTRFPLVDRAADTGKYVAIFLAEPDNFARKTVCAATRTHTMTEMAEIISKSTGKNIPYVQVPKDAFAGFLDEASRSVGMNMLNYFEEFGYYGKETEDVVKWAAQNANGNCTEFEEYLRREPLQL